MTIPRSMLLVLAAVSLTATADARPRKKPKARAKAPAAAPKNADADRLFKSGVALFGEGKYAEALAEFERAYEIEPHPLVLYNIAGCYRELSRYAEAVKFYTRFLDEGRGGKAPAARLTAAQSELDGILARVARVTVKVAPSGGTELVVDGASLGTFPLDMPLILAPGEHRILAKASGRIDAERTLRLASGDELDVELTLAEAPARGAETTPETTATRGPARGASRSEPSSAPRRSPPWFSIGAGYGTNLRRVEDTGVPTASLALRLHSRIELGVDGTFIAYAVMPSLRVRLFGDAFSVHLIGAAPISLTDDEVDDRFVAGAGGLGFRVRPVRNFALRVEALASYAGKQHGTTFPLFAGGELWF